MEIDTDKIKKLVGNYVVRLLGRPRRREPIPKMEPRGFLPRSPMRPPIGMGVGGRARLGEPKTELERQATHLKRLGTRELPPRGTGLRVQPRGEGRMPSAIRLQPAMGGRIAGHVTRPTMNPMGSGRAGRLRARSSRPSRGYPKISL